MPNTGRCSVRRPFLTRVKMKNILIGAVIALPVMLLHQGAVRAQDKKPGFGFRYATEVQTDFGGKANWVNLLSLNAGFAPWRNGELSIQTISVYKTRRERITDDLQVFSNIEEDNMAVNISLLGYTHSFGDITMFGGVRNINEDYFTSDYTSLFTNSSCGVYPTLSANFPLANYPASAMSLHAEFRLSENLTLKSSLYNGVAGRLYGNEPSVFNIRASDGIFCISELSYTPRPGSHGSYNAGVAVHSGHIPPTCKEPIKTKAVYAVWGSVERVILRKSHREAGVLLQASYAPGDQNDCRTYFGGGILLRGMLSRKKPDVLGVFVNRAGFREMTETAMELTWQYEIFRNITLQPSLHMIRRRQTDITGLLRLNYVF